MHFLEQILTGEKQVLLAKNVPSRIVPHFSELSVKECYPKAIDALPELKHYLPDPWGKEKKLPEREFFWRVMYAKYPQETEQYIRDVEDSKRSKTNLQDKQWNVNIKEEFIDELLKYDYASKKKGRGISSILMNKVGKGKVYRMNSKNSSQLRDSALINQQMQN